jgi:hypothetical protein
MPAAELVPHPLELRRVVDQPLVPEQRDHLAVSADRPPARPGLPDQGADHAVEGGAIQPVGGHELAQGLAGVKDQVCAAVPGGREVDTGLRQPGPELVPVLRGRDDDRHAPALKCAQQVTGHPFGQFLVVTVELNDVMTNVQVFSPNHRFSIR